MMNTVKVAFKNMTPSMARMLETDLNNKRIVFSVVQNAGLRTATYTLNNVRDERSLPYIIKRQLGLI